MKFALSEVSSIDMPKAVGGIFEDCGRDYLRGWEERGFNITVCTQYRSCFVGTPMSADQVVSETIANGIINILLMRHDNTTDAVAQAPGPAGEAGLGTAPVVWGLDTGAVSIVTAGGSPEAVVVADAPARSMPGSAGVDAGADLWEWGDAGVAAAPHHVNPKVALPRLPAAAEAATQEAGAEARKAVRPDAGCEDTVDASLSRAFHRPPTRMPAVSVHCMHVLRRMAAVPLAGMAAVAEHQVGASHACFWITAHAWQTPQPGHRQDGL